MLLVCSALIQNDSTNRLFIWNIGRSLSNVGRFRNTCIYIPMIIAKEKDPTVQVISRCVAKGDVGMNA